MCGQGFQPILRHLSSSRYHPIRGGSCAPFSPIPRRHPDPRRPVVDGTAAVHVGAEGGRAGDRAAWRRGVLHRRRDADGRWAMSAAWFVLAATCLAAFVRADRHRELGAAHSRRLRRPRRPRVRARGPAGVAAGGAGRALLLGRAGRRRRRALRRRRGRHGDSADGASPGSSGRRTSRRWWRSVPIGVLWIRARIGREPAIATRWRAASGSASVVLAADVSVAGRDPSRAAAPLLGAARFPASVDRDHRLATRRRRPDLPAWASLWRCP